MSQESLSTLFGSGVEIEAGGKTLHLRPLTVGQIGELEAHCRAKALKALNIALAGDDTMSAAEKRNMRMSLALEPIALDDMFPSAGDLKTRCPECDADSVAIGDAKLMRRQCAACQHEFTPTVPMKNADIAIRSFWLMVRDDADADLATFDRFQRWSASLSPEDWANMNATMMGLNGQEPADGDADPMAGTPSG